MGSWTVSVVSHGHGQRALRSIAQIDRQLGERPRRLILTLNQPDEPEPTVEDPGLAQRLQIRRNLAPQGFARNHNTALADASTDFILIADPCLDLPEPLFDQLEVHLGQAEHGIVSPQALAPSGQLEDNGRALVTPASLLRHYLLGEPRRPRSGRVSGPQPVDWLAGLFLAMRRETFMALGGFDERYFLYCEDVDLCLRARTAGLTVQLLPQLQIVHAANRDTRRKWRHLLWHIRSLLRLWRSAPYRQARRRRSMPG